MEQSRIASKEAREEFAALLIPLVALTSAVAIALLTVLNVRQRRSEIGTLRAIGIPSSTLLATFMMRAALSGLLGAAIGMLLSLAISRDTTLITPAEWMMVTSAAMLFSCAASWLPALIAASQDPARLLRHD